MPSARLKETLDAASRMVNEERRKSSRQGRLEGDDEVEDPAMEVEIEEESEQLEIWRLLPHLRGLPEAMLKKLPMSAVFQLNSALAKDQKISSKMNTNSKLAANAQKMITRPTKVQAGTDNRRDQLHQGRFLGGASCANTELWLTARKAVGEEGVLPLGNYDMDSVGCGGCVTPRGWLELHNPASQELKLKLFHLPNVANSGLSAKKVNLEGGEEALSIGENMKDILDLEGYKAALNTAREAMHSALPWNRSIGALVGFMVNTSYLQQDLGGNSRRAAILTEFTDYVLGRNALNWENAQPFLTTDELAHVWSNWKGKRLALFTSTKSEDKKSEGFKKKNDLCRLFNVGKCKNQADRECKTPWGKTLRHVCNKYMAGGKMCEKDHTRIDHK